MSKTGNVYLFAQQQKSKNDSSQLLSPPVAKTKEEKKKMYDTMCGKQKTDRYFLIISIILLSK